MARRSDHTKDELKGLAVDKAIEIIDENGAAGFSARGVAAAMGYTVGTLYHVFGDIDRFMLHVNARILDDWHAELARGLAKSRKDPLLYLGLSYVDFARGHYNRWRTLFEFRASPAPLPDWYAEKMARLFGLVEAALLPHAGDKRAARQSARILWAGIHGICVLSLSGKLDIIETEKPETLVRELLKTYMRGMA